MSKSLESHSKFHSLVLRHIPETIGLTFVCMATAFIVCFIVYGLVGDEYRERLIYTNFQTVKSRTEQLIKAASAKNTGKPILAKNLVIEILQDEEILKLQKPYDFRPFMILNEYPEDRGTIAINYYKTTNYQNRRNTVSISLYAIYRNDDLHASIPLSPGFIYSDKESHYPTSTEP